MKEYFRLQQKMLHRHWDDLGIPVIAAYFIFPILFIAFSFALFEKTEFASYLYILVALSLVSRLSETRRNDFLKSIFGALEYRLIRIIENSLFCLPFIIFMVYQQLFTFSAGLMLASLFMAVINFQTNTNFTIPTPFGNRPFEFVVGFRKTFFIFPIAYFLTYRSITANNFNLGIFSLILVALISLTYYTKPENEYFVWNHNITAKQFLFQKVKMAFAHFSLLSLPIVVVLGYFYFEHIEVLLGFVLICYVYLTTIIFAKYAAYPKEIGVPQGFMLALSLLFIPLLVVILPLFYSQSLKNLKPILND